MSMNSQSRGFTLIEILVTTGILAVLSTVTVLVVQPQELFKQARDARRITDIKALMQVLRLAGLGGNVIGNNDQVSVSIPDNDSSCSTIAGSLPTLEGGWTYRCATPTEYRQIDGMGWIAADFGDPFALNETTGNEALLAMVGTTYDTTGAVITVLPVDPINDVATGNYFMYLYTSNNYQFVTAFESQKYQALAAEDGGSDSTRYEVGIDLGLWPAAAVGI